VHCTNVASPQANKSALIRKATSSGGSFNARPISTEIHPVDQILATPGLLALGLQHVLVMYAGAVAVPLIMKLILLSSLRSPLD
jgi:hypothetical protein